MSFNFKKKTILIILIIIIAIIIGSAICFWNIKKENNEISNEQNEQVEISDTTPPIIVLDDVYVVETGYDKNLVDVIMSADDIDSNPNREIIGEYDLNTAGEYNLTYKIEDNSGNVTTKDFTLKVRDNYTYSENDINFNDAINQYKNDNTKIGIDVSKWQEEINWKEVAEEGVEFVIIRMGYQNGFDGEVLIDPYFEQNIKGCQENNLPVAVYFSSYAKTSEEAKNQATWICKNLQNYNYSNLSIAFDWENWSSFNKLGISLTDINNISDTFMNECVNLGYKSMLYSSKTYLENVWKNSNNYPVWLANYVSQTTYEGPYNIWQFCQTGIINGISGYVDINVMYENKM